MPSKALTNSAILKDEKVEVTQFILKVNMYKKGKESLIEVDFDLNPYAKIFDRNDVILNESRVKEIFNYITGNLFKSIKSICAKSGRKSRSLPSRSFERIGRILVKKNSPESVNVSYVSSHNGDMRPPI